MDCQTALDCIAITLIPAMQEEKPDATSEQVRNWYCDSLTKSPKALAAKLRKQKS